MGILLSALMISIVQNQLTLSFQQGYAVKCLIRDRLQEKLEHCAALLIKNQWQIHLRGGHLKDEDAKSSSRLSRKASRAFGDTKSVIKRKLSRAGSALSNQEARLSQEGRLPKEGELRSSCGSARLRPRRPRRSKATLTFPTAALRTVARPPPRWSLPLSSPSSRVAGPSGLHRHIPRARLLV